MALRVQLSPLEGGHGGYRLQVFLRSGLARARGDAVPVQHHVLVKDEIGARHRSVAGDVPQKVGSGAVRRQQVSVVPHRRVVRLPHGGVVPVHFVPLRIGAEQSAPARGRQRNGPRSNDDGLLADSVRVASGEVDDIVDGALDGRRAGVRSGLDLERGHQEGVALSWRGGIVRRGTSDNDHLRKQTVVPRSTNRSSTRARNPLQGSEHGQPPPPFSVFAEYDDRSETADVGRHVAPLPQRPMSLKSAHSEC
eukprot:4217582-Pyramimonas_sp.AAC.1